MRETELRDSLLITVDAEPPLALDIDDVITRARKETSRRRALLVTGAATLVLVGGIVVGPIVTKSMGGAQTAGFPGPAPSAQPPADLPVWRESQLAPKVIRLATRVPARIKEIIPEATDIVSSPDRTANSRGYVALSQITKFKIAGQQYAIEVKAMAFGVHELVASGACEPADTICQQGLQYRLDVLDPFRQVYWVEELRPDNSVVTASWHESETVSVHPSTEVIHGFLTALAKDPALHF